MLKIAIFCDLLPTLLNLRGLMTGAMAEVADEVVVVAPPSEERFVSQLKHEHGANYYPISVDRTGINPIGDLGYRREISKFLREFRPSHTFAYQAKAAVYSSIAAREFPSIKTNVLFPGLGYLFAQHGSFKDRCVRWFGRKLYKYAFKKVDQFFFQNPDDLKTLQDARIIPADARTTIVNGSGVPLGDYPFTPPVRQPVRFLYMGRLLWEKGVGEFCEAAKTLSSKWNDDCEFNILGPLDSNPSAISRQELDSLCRDSHVQYLGVADDVRPFLSKTSVFVLPSYYMEGTPRSILEAMSMGRPIVTTDSRGCREPLEEGVNGFLIAPKDSEQLTERLSRFLENRSLIESMGQESRRIAEEKYDVHKVNASILKTMGLTS